MPMRVPRVVDLRPKRIVVIRLEPAVVDRDRAVDHGRGGRAGNPGVGGEACRRGRGPAAPASRAAADRRSARGRRSPSVDGCVADAPALPLSSSDWSPLTSRTSSSCTRSPPYFTVAWLPGAVRHSTPCVRSASCGQVNFLVIGMQDDLPGRVQLAGLLLDVRREVEPLSGRRSSSP